VPVQSGDCLQAVGLVSSEERVKARVRGWEIAKACALGAVRHSQPNE